MIINILQKFYLLLFQIKKFGQLINISPQAFTMINTVNTECKSYTNYSINIIKMRYSTEPNLENMLKVMNFCLLLESLEINIVKH